MPHSGQPRRGTPGSSCPTPCGGRGRGTPQRRALRVTEPLGRRPLRGFHPHFLFGAPKRKRRWSRQKKKRFSLRSYGRGAPCRAAGRGPKRSCSVKVIPMRTRAGLSADFRTWYAVLHSEVIGQKSNLTSSSFRAQSAASAVAEAAPLLGWSLRRFPPIPRNRGRGRFAARRLAWVVDWAFRRGRCPHRPVAGASVDLP